MAPPTLLTPGNDCEDTPCYPCDCDPPTVTCNAGVADDGGTYRVAVNYEITNAISAYYQIDNGAHNAITLTGGGATGSVTVDGAATIRVVATNGCGTAECEVTVDCTFEQCKYLDENDNLVPVEIQGFSLTGSAASLGEQYAPCFMQWPCDFDPTGSYYVECNVPLCRYIQRFLCEPLGTGTDHYAAMVLQATHTESTLFVKLWTGARLLNAGTNVPEDQWIACNGASPPSIIDYTKREWYFDRTARIYYCGGIGWGVYIKNSLAFTQVNDIPASGSAPDCDLSGFSVSLI